MQITERGCLGSHPAFLLIFRMNDETFYTWEQWNTLIETYKKRIEIMTI